MLNPQEILDFWFGSDLDNLIETERRAARWFKKSDNFDDEIGTRFGDFPEKARNGAYQHWLTSDSGRLAFVIGTDQFPRNLYRDTAQAFRYDALALECALESMELGLEKRLHPLQSVFLYMPLEHAEDLQRQKQCVTGLSHLVQSAPPAYKEKLENFLRYALAHQEVIEKFGRFPHRNAILGRDSTAQELAFLASGKGSF